MSTGDVIWLMFMFVAFQPVVKQKFLEASRQRLIEKIERQRKSRVITLIHRQETMSMLGFPFFRYIDINDSEEVIRAIHMTDPEVPLDIVLHTPGGLALASLQIARAINSHKGKVTVFVPYYAMSGGTLIALAADEIVMCRHAVLGPVDPQLGKFPAVSLLKLARKKETKEIEDETLVLIDQAEKAISQMEESVYELTRDNLPEEKARELAVTMSQGRWTHDYPISCQEAIQLGLKISCDMPEEVMNLMTLYPQPIRRQPTVEYVPEPKGKTM